MDFKERYDNLNDAQKEAVDTIDGPVMVVAGPGTGKTELLSVRVANILKQTDVMPENILCLTFTDSGATSMRKRLSEIIGANAYRVAIHTFHSFGSEIINQNGEYFYQGAHFRPADELSSYEIVRGIFEDLNYNNPLSSKMNDEYTHISDSLKVISELKSSGLTSDELLAILDQNDATIEKTEQLLSPIFYGGRPTMATVKSVSEHVETIRNSDGDTILSTVTPLSKILADSLQQAVDCSIEINKSTPLTTWRNEWFKKDKKGDFILKSHINQEKLRAMSYIYEQYLVRMQQAELYDYNDMILRVVHAMEIFSDLRYNLQEKYQYILVDEFQDTNMAQMRILHNLTNNEVVGDMPNIMVVGDDDQAIYIFQGADVSNILNFRENYPKARVITLTENYRSIEKILSGSRDVIIQGKNRLEEIFKNEIDKKLNTNKKHVGQAIVYEAESISNERHFIVKDIKKRIESGEKPGDIAVLTRRHSEIAKLLPYFAKYNIPINYEKRENVLEQPIIKYIDQLSRLLINISSNKHNEVNVALPEILAHEMWGIEPIKLWKLSLKAYRDRMSWMEVMAASPDFVKIHEWLISTSIKTVDTPLEQILDIIIGKPTDGSKEEFISPIYEYFFSNEKLTNKTEEYLSYLNALRAIRSKLREYRPDQIPTLKTFIEFIDLNRKVGASICTSQHLIRSDESVNVMTAHKSKGQEFETVYVMNAVDSVWGKKARTPSRMIKYPENLPLEPAGETDDERLRLFYVALTRAKSNLFISYSLLNDSGKETMQAIFLVNCKYPLEKIPSLDAVDDVIEAAELDWYQPILKVEGKKMHELLLPILENYKLSVTHLHNFLDVTRGGPSTFLLQNILQFPQAKSPNAAYGTAIHSTLQIAHSKFSATGEKQTVEDIVSSFESNLHDQYLEPRDFQTFLEKGCEALRTFLDKKYDDFQTSQKVELNFSRQQSIIGNAHLTGKLDLVDINLADKEFIVTDYKTGKPAYDWKGNDPYEKIKLHKYQQQLMFYKLLVENSCDYHNYSVTSGVMQFIEPDSNGNINDLVTDFSDLDMERFTKLINSVWQHIIELKLPDTSSYEQSIKGIAQFEQDLIDETI